MIVPLTVPTRREALRMVLIGVILQVPTTKKEFSATAYGAVILMIAFMLSSFVIGLGGKLLGLPDVRLRMGVSLGFFILVFLALVIYENLRRRFG